MKIKMMESLIASFICIFLVGCQNTQVKSVEGTTSLKTITTLEQFNTEVLGANKPVVVKFYAPWCEICKKMEKTFDSLAEKYKTTCDFVAIDASKSIDLVNKYDVFGTPTFLIFKQGKEVMSGKDRLIGLVSQHDFEQAIRKVLN